MEDKDHGLWLPACRFLVYCRDEICPRELYLVILNVLPVSFS